MPVPSLIPNWIAGEERPAASGDTLPKLRPHDGAEMCRVARSGAADVREAVLAAKAAQPAWADTTPVCRGEILYDVCLGLRARREEIARIVAEETGKSYKSALGETDGAIALGLFYAGEGQRLFGRSMTSGTPHKYTTTVRQPVGIAGLIIAANTPIANVAWKVFPALICGNGAVLKAAEDTPATAWIFSAVAHAAGLPGGLLNVVQGFGPECGEPLVADPDVGVVSFTGSTAVGRRIAVIAGERLGKVSLELGGKNALVVCDDAEIENAVKWTILSAFSNAGQRCAAGSRVVVFDSVYDRFRSHLVEQTERLRVGPGDDDDFGPVINERQLRRMVAAVEQARDEGAVVLTGGHRLADEAHRSGFYMAPTLLENVSPEAEISNCELFGPVACLYRVRSFSEALELTNASPYGLTAAIHTRSIHRAVQFTQKVQAGVANVNVGTFGSEPHMPFGGVKHSGNGTREPGTEALDIYSDLKAISFVIDPALV